MKTSEPAICIFYKDSICEASLSKLATNLATEDGINISPQDLSERFNEYAVEFLKIILKEI